MKLYGTLTSSYVRTVRVMVIETGLDAQVEFVPVRTRVPDCPVNAFNPTGKVPTLATDDGYYLSESRLVCEYLDGLHSGPPFMHSTDTLAARAYEGVLTGFADGVAVWVRELVRAANERSPGILEQERNRAERCLDYLETATSWHDDPVNYLRVLLATTIAVLDGPIAHSQWSIGRPGLEAWYRRFAARPSMLQTVRPDA